MCRDPCKFKWIHVCEYVYVCMCVCVRECSQCVSERVSVIVCV